MAYPTSIDSTTAVVQFLYQAPGWPTAGAAQIYVYGLQLPPGWTLRKAVLVLPDGGSLAPFAVELRERFTFWCYGTTPLESLQVANSLLDVLQDSTTLTCTVGGKKVMLANATRVMGPTFLVEPVTEWPRTLAAYDVQLVRYAAA